MDSSSRFGTFERDGSRWNAQNARLIKDSIVVDLYAYTDSENLFTCNKLWCYDITHDIQSLTRLCRLYWDTLVVHVVPIVAGLPKRYFSQSYLGVTNFSLEFYYQVITCSANDIIIYEKNNLLLLMSFPLNSIIIAVSKLVINLVRKPVFFFFVLGVNHLYQNLGYSNRNLNSFW